MLVNQNVSVHYTTMWLFNTINNKRAFDPRLSVEIVSISDLTSSVSTYCFLFVR